MGAGTDAQVVAEIPVVQIVRAPATGARVRRYLVLLEARRCKQRSAMRSSISSTISSAGCTGGGGANTVPGSIVSW